MTTIELKSRIFVSSANTLHHLCPYSIEVHIVLKNTTIFSWLWFQRLEAYRQLLKSLSTKVENKPTSSTTKSVCQEEFSNLLKNSEMTSRLFPNGHFSSMWTPLRVQPENSKHVFADSGAVFGSHTSDPSKTMLSIGHPVKNAVGVMYVIDMYGDHTSDPSKTMLSIGHPVKNAVEVMYVIDMPHKRPL